MSSPMHTATQIPNRCVRATKYFDPDVVQQILSWPDVCSFVGCNSWFRLLRLGCSTYPRLAKEFLCTLRLTHTGERYLENFGIEFQLDGASHTLSIVELNEIYGIEHAQTRTYFREFDAGAMWQRMTSGEQYEQSTARAAAIRNPTLRYMHYVVANTIFGRSRGVERVYPWDIFAIWSLTTGNQVNMMYFMFKHFEQIVIPHDSTIVVGGFITQIAQYLGVNLDLYEEVSGNRKVDLSLLHTYGMISQPLPPHFLLHFNNRSPIVLPNFERIRLDKDENWKMEYVN